jgi:ankyrin repeat protein
LACQYNQSESVIQLLIKEYPMAVQQTDHDGFYPLHLACLKNHSKNVILVLIDTYLLAVKAIDNSGSSPLDYVKNNGHSKTIINVLATLMEKSDDDLKNRIDIPMIVTINGLENRQRHDRFQWLLRNVSLK